MRQTLAVALAAIILLSGCGSDKPKGGNSGSSGAAPAAPPGSLEIIFTYGSEQKDWNKDVTDAFNAQNLKSTSGKTIFVSQIPMGSGDCMDEILDGTRRTHLTSPASAAFVKLGNAKWKAKNGKDLVASTENLLLS